MTIKSVIKKEFANFPIASRTKDLPEDGSSTLSRPPPPQPGRGYTAGPFANPEHSLR